MTSALQDAAPQPPDITSKAFPEDVAEAEVIVGTEDKTQ
jgi:hypothetical protein